MTYIQKMLLFTICTCLWAEMLPENGTVLNYTQVFFRWDQIPSTDSYQFTLQNMNTIGHGLQFTSTQCKSAKPFNEANYRRLRRVVDARSDVIDAVVVDEGWDSVGEKDSSLLWLPQPFIRENMFVSKTPSEFDLLNAEKTFSDDDEDREGGEKKGEKGEERILWWNEESRGRPRCLVHHVRQ